MDLCWFCRLMGREQRPGEKRGPVATTTDEHGNRGLYIDQFGLF
jgi:hypothetical protein